MHTLISCRQNTEKCVCPSFFSLFPPIYSIAVIFICDFFLSCFYCCFCCCWSSIKDQFSCTRVSQYKLQRHLNEKEKRTNEHRSFGFFCFHSGSKTVCFIFVIHNIWQHTEKSYNMLVYHLYIIAQICEWQQLFLKRLNEIVFVVFFLNKMFCFLFNANDDSCFVGCHK